MNEEDGIRLEEFRQLKKEIRGCGEYLIVGIDVAKEKHHAFFGNATGKTLIKRLVFDNTIEGFRKLRVQVEAIQTARSLPKVVFGLEPTANYHKPLGEHLIKCGKMVVLVSGVAVKRNRELLNGRWDKHDDKDAAEYCRLDFPGEMSVLRISGHGTPGSASLPTLKENSRSRNIVIGSGFVTNF